MIKLYSKINFGLTLFEHTDLKQTMKQVWHSMPVFISDVKKENRTKKKNGHGGICFLINYKFLCKLSFKIISCFCFCSYIV